MLSAMEEIRFWTGIMRDHGEFILTSLSFNEQEAINTALFYKNAFAKLHEQSKTNMDKKEEELFINEVVITLTNFINFKRLLLRRLLECKLSTSLPPTFYNHMINEAMLFYSTLMKIQHPVEINPLFEIINLHNIWLPDAAGHAATIACDLDPVEKLLIKEAQEFEKTFLALSMKAEELGTMLLRTSLNDGVLERLNEEVTKNIQDFICYLDKIRDLATACKILSVLKPLIPDHMMREEHHYLQNIKALQVCALSNLDECC